MKPTPKTAKENVLDDLPRGWVVTTLGEISEKPEYGWTTSANAINGDIKLLRTTDISKRVIDWSSVPYCAKNPPDQDRFRIRPGDIVISRAGSVGLSALIEESPPSVFASYLIRFRPASHIDRRYVSYFLKSPSYWNAISASAAGIALQNVNAKKLAAIRLPLAPVLEQHRVVAEIEKQFTRLDAAVEALKLARAKLKRYRASVLKAACEGRLVPTEAELARAEGRDYEPADLLLQRILKERRAKWEADEFAKIKTKGRSDEEWKTRYKEPAALTRADLSKLPRGWAWASLDQCFIVERGRFSIRPRNDPRYYDGPYPFVQIGDLPRDGGSIREFSQTLNKDGLAISKMFSAGTVLIAIVGATIANTGILTFDSCCPDSLVAIQSKDGVRSRFADIYLRSKREEIRRSSYSSGGQPNINLATLLPYPLPAPPLAEQGRIVAEVERRLSVIEELEALVTANLKRAERLRQSILKRAFEGKLVPQDPNDEPASVLLGRIRAERIAKASGAMSGQGNKVNRKCSHRRASKKDAEEKKVV